MERPLHSFAHAMAGDILNSSIKLSERSGSAEDCPASFHPSDRETLADVLAAAAIQAALREACGSGTVENSPNSKVDFQKSNAPLSPLHAYTEPGMKGKNTLDGKPSFLSGGATRERGGDVSVDMDVEMDCRGEASLSDLATTNPVTGSSNLHASRGSQYHHPLLPQSGLPVLGSLDYPDAPPTTPLLPEMIRRGDSFGRKLKGGLAKEFLPSPPPPTPKEKQHETEGLAGEYQAAVVDARMEFMENLMHLLSTEGGEPVWKEDLSSGTGEGSFGRANDGVGLQDRAKMAAYAETLSGDILGWVTDHYPARMREQIGCEDDEEDYDDDDGLEDYDGIHLLANRLAETIIASTMNEALVLKES